MLALDMPPNVAAVLHAEAKAMAAVVDEFLQLKRKDNNMAKGIDEKKQAVIDALEELFGDTSVSKKETLDALEEIESEVASKCDALKADIKHDEQAGEDSTDE